MAQRYLEPEHSLGKGEVLSSILSGSTRKAHETRAFDTLENPISAVAGRTDTESSVSERGVSVDYVHAASNGMEKSMDPKMKTESGLKRWAELLWDYVYLNTRRGRQLHPTVAKDVKDQLEEIEAARRELPR